MSTKMKAALISKPGGDWELVEREIPEPGAGQVRVKVEACGICHSDVLVKEGLWPGLQYPRVPGHEVAGRIDAVGENVTAWTSGQRVGVGWHGGHCFVCDLCRRGDASVTAWPRSVIDSSHHSRADDYAYRVASGVAPGTAGIRDDAASRRLSILIGFPFRLQ